MSAATILVGVCTFRRPSLQQTLESVVAQALPDGTRFRVAVADNDETPSARDLVRQVAARTGQEIAYIHAPARNISLARNALLDEAVSAGALLAFLDDDEWVEPDWLARLLDAKAASGADAVFGPVRGVYAAEAPDWMQRGEFHDTLPELDAAGRMRTGYTSNVLLDPMAPTLHMRRFDPAFGRSGGEDTAFFADAKKDGARLAPAPDAWAFEHVPVDRARASWLIRRRFRAGQTHGKLIAQDASPVGRTGLALVAGAKVTACLAMAAAQGFDATRRNRTLLRGSLHAGVASALMGAHMITLYGGDESRSSSTKRRMP